MDDTINLKKRFGDLVLEELDVLDLGCGSYSSGIASQILTMKFKSLTSVDGYEPDIKVAQEKIFDTKDHTWVLADVREFDIEDNKYDVIMSFDVIEHMVKEDSIKLIEKIEKKAKKKIILFFPNEPEGFFRHWDADNNVLQEHLSRWTDGELEARGYKTHRISGLHTEWDGEKNITFDATWAVKDIA